MAVSNPQISFYALFMVAIASLLTIGALQVSHFILGLLVVAIGVSLIPSLNFRSMLSISELPTLMVFVAAILITVSVFLSNVFELGMGIDVLQVSIILSAIAFLLSTPAIKKWLRW